MKFWRDATRVAVLAAVVASLVITAVPLVPAQGQASMTLRITWFKWPPADLLQQMGNLYTQSYPNIKIVVDEPPATQWFSSAFDQFLAGKTTFDAAVGDSQWLGLGATKGYYVDLTSWMKANLPLQDFVPSLLASYGQYPQAKPGVTGGLDLVNGHFYGVPFEADALAWAYLVRRSGEPERLHGEVPPLAARAAEHGRVSRDRRLLHPTQQGDLRHRLP